MEAPQLLDMGLVYPNRAGRPVDKRAVSRLAASMEAIGLQTPLTVRPCQRVRNGAPADAFEIVAGRHRYEAAISLKWAKINAFVQPWDDDDAQLWEIDENLMRAELSDAQRADHHARRRDLLVKKGLVQPHGGDRKSSGQTGRLKSYTAQASEAVGQSERAVRRDLARGSKIAPAILAEVSGTALDKGTVLDTLARTPTDQQPATVARMWQDEQQRQAERASRVPLAKPPLNDAEATELQLNALMTAWNKAGADARARFRARIGDA